MRARTIRRWSWVHKWTSVICTGFLLMLCITGLPLIFHHEIDYLLHEEVEPPAMPTSTAADLDRVVANGLTRFPGEVVQFVVWDRDERDVVMLSVAKAPDANPENNKIARMDARTGAFLDQPDLEGRLTTFLLRLHTDMFAGLPGKLFLGLMGLLFAVAIVSGIVVYGPSMRKLAFGTVRHSRPRVVRWLDLHNLIGIVLVVWTLVVGLTGVINTWADLALKLWQFDQLAEMIGPYRDRPTPERLASVQATVTLARERLPGMTPSFVAYPGSIFTSKSHYAVFMRGDSPLTARLLRPVLVDASDGTFTDSRDLPWYVSAVLLSQPLHFGDYGGMPLKIVWALLDLATIALLITGLYLWLARRNTLGGFRGARTELGSTAETNSPPTRLTSLSENP